MSQAAVLDDHYDRDWGSDAVATIVALSIAQESFACDDLRKIIRTPPRSAQYGAAFRSAQSQGLIEPISSVKSTAKSRNHGRQLQWRRKTTEGVTP